MHEIEAALRDVPDFPKPGIVFKDITPMLADAALFRQCIDAFKERLEGRGIDLVVGIEARGFVFSSALAYALGVGNCMVRKPGKLPYKTVRKTYALEYGEDTVELHADAFTAGQRIVIIDDVLATGGTVAATVQLIEEHFDVEIVEIDFLMELSFLNGRAKLPNQPIFSLLMH